VKRVVFLSEEDVERSQIAAAFFNPMANPELARAVAVRVTAADFACPQRVPMMTEEAVQADPTPPDLLNGVAVESTCGWRSDRVAGSRPSGRARPGLFPSCAVSRWSPFARSVTHFATGFGS
jgi:hypothetical protein